MLSSIISAVFSGFWSWFLSLFGKSNDQKLGEAVVKEDDLQRQNEVLNREVQLLADRKPADTAERMRDGKF